MNDAGRICRGTVLHREREMSDRSDLRHGNDSALLGQGSTSTYSASESLLRRGGREEEAVAIDTLSTCGSSAGNLSVRCADGMLQVTADRRRASHKQRPRAR